MTGTWLANKGALAIGATSLIAAVSLVCVGLGADNDALSPRAAEAAAATAVGGNAEVMHFWISGSEREAVNVFRDAYAEAYGADTWIDSPQPSQSDLRRALMNRFGTGTPPVAVMWQSNVELRDLAELGLFARLDDVAAREDWDEVLAPAVRARVQVDGHYYMAPTNIHGLNWIFYNKTLLAELGIEEPRTWPEVLEAMRAIEASGRRAVAFGGTDWEAQVAFATILASTMGRDSYRRLLAQSDASMLETEGALEAYRIFSEIRRLSQSHRPYNGWDHAAVAIAQGEAGFQFMGDWVKGEYSRAGATTGVEIGCMLAPGSENALMLTIDGFAFPATHSASGNAARQALAGVLLDRETQQRFAVTKGTVPARGDAFGAELDPCEQTIARLLQDPRAPIESPNAGLPSAQAGDYQVAITEFFNSAMTPDEGVRALADVFRRTRTASN